MYLLAWKINQMLLKMWTLTNIMYIMRVNKAIFRPFPAVFRKPYIIHSQRVYAILIFLCGNFIHRIVQCKSWRWNIHGGAQISMSYWQAINHIYISVLAKHGAPEPSCLNCQQNFILYSCHVSPVSFHGAWSSRQETNTSRIYYTVNIIYLLDLLRPVMLSRLLPCFYTLYSF